MQPPLDEEQIDHPTRPAGQPDRLIEGGRVDVGTCVDPCTKIAKMMIIHTLKATIEKARATLRSIHCR